jgi:hypothetical protein
VNHLAGEPAAVAGTAALLRVNWLIALREHGAVVDGVGPQPVEAGQVPSAAGAIAGRDEVERQAMLPQVTPRDEVAVVDSELVAWFDAVEEWGACSPLVLRMSAATVEMMTLRPAARPVMKVILAPNRASGSATLLLIEIPTL